MDSKQLFITSLPAHLTEEQLYHFFSDHVRVVDIELRRKKNTNYSKGYGVLKLANKFETRKLLKKQLYIEDRLVILQPYLKGKKLKAWQKKVKETRIVIKNVPFQVSDKELHFLFSQFGRVVSAFCSTTNQIRKPHGFVTFETKQAAIRCLRLGTVRVRNRWTISCEKFDERVKNMDRIEKEKLDRQKWEDLHLLHQPIPGSAAYHQIERIFDHRDSNLIFVQAFSNSGAAEKLLKKLEQKINNIATRHNSKTVV